MGKTNNVSGIKCKFKHHNYDRVFKGWRMEIPLQTHTFFIYLVHFIKIEGTWRHVLELRLVLGTN